MPICQNPNWIVIRQTCSGSRNSSISYVGDAGKFNVDQILAESEEGLDQLMSANIPYDHLSLHGFGERIKHLIEHDVDSVITGILRRLAESLHEEGWNSYWPVPTNDVFQCGEILASKYGVEIRRLNVPLEVSGAYLEAVC
jgi:hypothetical protein